MLHVYQICIRENGELRCVPLADPFNPSRIKDEQDAERLSRFYKNAIEADENIEARIIFEVKEKKPGFAWQLLTESEKEPDADALLQKLTRREREVLLSSVKDSMTQKFPRFFSSPCPPLKLTTVKFSRSFNCTDAPRSSLQLMREK
jgi:hypothetical protein